MPAAPWSRGRYLVVGVPHLVVRVEWPDFWRRALEPLAPALRAPPGAAGEGGANVNFVQVEGERAWRCARGSAASRARRSRAAPATSPPPSSALAERWVRAPVAVRTASGRILVVEPEGPPPGLPLAPLRPRRVGRGRGRPPRAAGRATELRASPGRGGLYTKRRRTRALVSVDATTGDLVRAALDGRPGGIRLLVERNWDRLVRLARSVRRGRWRPRTRSRTGLVVAWTRLAGLSRSRNGSTPGSAASCSGAACGPTTGNEAGSPSMPSRNHRGGATRRHRSAPGRSSPASRRASAPCSISRRWRG